MNREEDFIGQLEQYLEDFDGAGRLPDHVRDAIRAELPRTRQVRPVPGSGRMLDMISRASTRARVGLAAAAVVAAVVLGAAVINNGHAGPGIGSVAATASPQVTPSPTLTPSPTPSPPPPKSLSGAFLEACPSGASGCLVPGTYRLSSLGSPGQVTLDVPAGWFQWQPAADFEGVLVDSGPSAPQESGWGLMFLAVGSVSKDPCNPAKGTFDPTRTVDGLVAEMSSWPGFKATAPTPITVGGVSGQLIELTSTRTSTDCATPVLWTTPLGGTLNGYSIVDAKAKMHKVQLRIVDIGTSLLVIRTTDYPETSPNEASQGVAANPTRHKADQVVLHRILDSIRVTIAPPQP